MKKEFILNGVCEAFDLSSTEDGELLVIYQGRKYLISPIFQQKNQMVLKSGNKIHKVFFAQSTKEFFTTVDGCDIINEKTNLKRVKGASPKENGYLSPMPGKILRVLVKPGDEVKKGQILLIMEAMKMEHSIAAQKSGFIRTVNFKQGDFVEGEMILLEMN